MSGGHFDYVQYRIQEIIEKIKDVIFQNKKERSKEDVDPWELDDDGNIKEYYRYHYYFSDKTIEEFKNAVNILQQAYVYAQRIDWLLSGDDGEESFHRRLAKDMEEINASINSFNEYQKLMDKRSVCPEDMKVVYPALGIAGEAGEVADKVKKICRDDNKDFSKHREEIAKELGDVLWYISRLAGDLGYKLSDIAQINIDKVNSRWNTNTVHGEGDNREIK